VWFECCVMLACMVDVVQEDSGNYTCEVRGPQSTVLHNITHHVLVRSNYRINLSFLADTPRSVLLPTDVKDGETWQKHRMCESCK